MGVGAGINLGVGDGVAQTQFALETQLGLRQTLAGITCEQALPAGQGGVGGW